MGSGKDSDSDIAWQGAKAILGAFQEYMDAFAVITGKAPLRFAGRDWHGMQSDAVERLDLYANFVNQIVAHLSREVLHQHARELSIWSSMRDVYAQVVVSRSDRELAETFFNSVSRRILVTVGVDERVGFLHPNDPAPDPAELGKLFRTYLPGDRLEDLIERILLDHSFSVHYLDVTQDACRVAGEIRTHLDLCSPASEIDRIETLVPVFYRNKGAYIVGRIRCQERVIPLLIALRHPPAGLRVDAVLLTDDEVSIVFSFTRSYFHVETDAPHTLVAFLKAILPLKRISELYISIGHNKHGKTLLFGELMDHMNRTHDQFIIARGERGMVMVVFTMPSFDMVFKVIRDHFADPKTVTREEVKNKYRLVFRHDRAGRLVDAQEFEHLKFSCSRFTPELLQELQATCGENVVVSGDEVVFKHLYTERRMIPLDIYVREAPEDAVKEAVLDYGQAIKDLAATNIFPGDILLKNFGVTRHGRVVFYDYDELIPVTECRFRQFPKARSYEDELESEPWFFVDRNDIFPEEFSTFLGLSEPYRSVFETAHQDLFGIKFWRSMQKIHQNGEIVDIFPYKRFRRFDP